MYNCSKATILKAPTTAKCVTLTVWGAEAWSQEQIYSCPCYLVPNNLSPASPKPGNMYPCSFNLSSRAATNISTSG